MISGKLLRQTLDKFMKGEVAQNARVQVVLPNGEFYDIQGIQLMENKLLTIRAAENVVRILPPLNVKKNELDEALKIINKVCSQFK